MTVKIDGDRILKSQLEKLKLLFPEECRAIVAEVAMVDVETFAKKNSNNIPVDTGRLRNSIHTEFVNGFGGYTPKPTTYTDDAGNSFNGKLSASLDNDSVVVGTNLEYAQKINRIGGGGENSRRKSKGEKRPKGYGQGFWDRAIKNGEVALLRELSDLIRRAGGLV